ncbi:RNA-directed DNA polymerase from mobile element jockey-like [Plakobranchus ocellatus]|uniref:RNA-directed DNA polymerase from mobile element jockey-like n=1 Tax=Plakobranchus ocellatus TaxID=259542 RepID=A0AAV4DKA9_9GAST|nr:RNA-directed DNA polymerase from mobile element jockey-like [Plakobranchus ocellatus]
MASTNIRKTKSCATQKTVPDFNGHRPRIAKRTRYAKRKGGYRKPPTSNFGSLRVMQINVQGCQTLRHTELRTILIKKGVHIVLAQETLLGRNKEYSLPGYVCYRCQCHLSGKACRGIATFVRKDLRATVRNVQTPSSSDIQAIQVWWRGKKFQPWNWYQPPSDKSVSFVLGKGTHRFTRTLVAGDANAHHPAFGYENSDAVGEWVVDLMIVSNLTSLVTERSEPTYLHSRGGLFRPDIALISSDLEESTTREVLDNVGSDHLPSLITINCCAPAQGRDSKPRWNYRRANWSVYRDTLDNALNNVLPDKLTISALNEAFTRAVIYAARRGVPRGVIHKYSPIWSTEFAQAVAKRNQAQNDH